MNLPLTLARKGPWDKDLGAAEHRPLYAALQSPADGIVCKGGRVLAISPTSWPLELLEEPGGKGMALSSLQLPLLPTRWHPCTREAEIWGFTS